MRIINYQIESSESSLKVKNYLKGKGYSTRTLIRLKTIPEDVRVNGDPVHMDFPLSEGDVLTITAREEDSSEKILPVELPLDIVYEDEDIIVLNKPAGMPIHPSMNNYENSLANALAFYYQKQHTPFIYRCITRLDRDTSGLVLIAKHFISAGILSGLISGKSEKNLGSEITNGKGIRREYLAIVKGNVSPTSGVITAPLGRKEGSVIERTVDFEKGERAITHYKVLQTQNGYSLVSLNLETGRTHQIRIHMKYLGYPLIGDYLYNPDYTLISRQALHSYRLSFPHPITGQAMEFTTPPPDDMNFCRIFTT